MAAGTALLVVDAQVAILDGPDPTDVPAYRRDEVLARIGGLLARARAAGTPVLYVQHENPDFAPLTAGSPGWRIHPAVAPLPGERVVAKRASDSFYGTPLRSELDAKGITHLVVVGCDTQFCVDSTVRRALSLDYDVTLVADAHTTYEGGPLPAAQVVAHHNETLAELAHPSRAVAVKPASDVVF